MATYTVTTASDVVDANDGVLSLREAIAQANATAAADTINFASNLFYVSVGTFASPAGFEIEASGGALTINGDHDDDGQGDIALNNGFGTKITVKQGANLTLVGVDFINGNSQATPAAAGTSQGRAESSVVPAGPPASPAATPSISTATTSSMPMSGPARSPISARTRWTTPMPGTARMAARGRRGRIAVARSSMPAR